MNNKFEKKENNNKRKTVSISFKAWKKIRYFAVDNEMTMSESVDYIVSFFENHVCKVEKKDKEKF